MCLLHTALQADYRLYLLKQPSGISPAAYVMPTWLTACCRLPLAGQDEGRHPARAAGRVRDVSARKRRLHGARSRPPGRQKGQPYQGGQPHQVQPHGVQPHQGCGPPQAQAPQGQLHQGRALTTILRKKQYCVRLWVGVGGEALFNVVGVDVVN